LSTLAVGGCDYRGVALAHSPPRIIRSASAIAHANCAIVPRQMTPREFCLGDAPEERA